MAKVEAKQEQVKKQEASNATQQKQSEKSLHPSLNIGLVGHIDHGKTTLLYKLTGIWASKHSEELKRGITIKLGYADAMIRRCLECGRLTISEKCEDCNGSTKQERYVSFVDAPGHEMLMATMLSGAAIIDAAILVIAANEKCPQPQTKEHLMALEAKGISHIIIVQNKIDLINREDALRNYAEIKEFVKGTIAENAPIIPVSAQQGVNIDILLEELSKLPVPQRDTKSDPLFLIVRSFDVNRPGTPVQKLIGGVLGGTLKRGILHKGDKVEIRPGIVEEKAGKISYKPIKTTIADLVSGKNHLQEALQSGSLAISTLLDPFLTKSDSLAGSVLGLEGKMPAVVYELMIKTKLFEKVVGTAKEIAVEALKMNEPILLSVNTSVSVGIISELSKDKEGKEGKAKLKLKLPVVEIKGSNIGLARNIQGRWRLIGYGVVE